MDLWVVAAAAGAGYIATNLQNLSLDKRETQARASYKDSYSVQSESANILQQLRDNFCPFRRLARKRAQDAAFLESENHFDDGFWNSDGLSEAGVASAEGDAALEKNEKQEVYNMELSSSMPSVFGAEFEDGEGRNFSRINKGKFFRSSRRPLDALGSCLDAQVCRVLETMEDDGSFLYPPKCTVMPLLAADENQKLGQSGSHSSSESCRADIIMSNLDTTTPRPSSLERLESVEMQRNSKKFDSLDGVSGQYHSNGPRAMLYFITGMTVGILSATTAWKNEVDRLEKQLTQMQNFAQDLQEELDMKETLMVKELTDEGDLPLGDNNTPPSIPEPIASPADTQESESTEIYSLKENQTNAENLELMSKIEAELQAELELLEHSMKASAVERISSFVEPDPDFEPEIVRGDVRSLMASGIHVGGSESENETVDGAMDCSRPADYAVCPWELSLRLHELIESRLEAHIRELEIALANGQNRVQFMDSQTIGRKCSYSETESSSTHHRPTCACEDEHEHDERKDEYSAKNLSPHWGSAPKQPDSLTSSCGAIGSWHSSTFISSNPGACWDFAEVTADEEYASSAVDKGNHPFNQRYDGECYSILHPGITEEGKSVDLVQAMQHMQTSKCCASDEESMHEEELLMNQKCFSWNRELREGNLVSRIKS